MALCLYGLMAVWPYGCMALCLYGLVTLWPYGIWPSGIWPYGIWPYVCELKRSNRPLLIQFTTLKYTTLHYTILYYTTLLHYTTIALIPFIQHFHAWTLRVFLELF